MDQTGPCNWPTAGCPSCGECDGLTASQRAALVAQAHYELWAATGRVYGTCDVSVLPCNDYATLCGCGVAFRQCGCVSVPEIKLPGPVASVTAVVVDGETLDDTDYRIDDYQWLVRLDGGTWPANSDPTDPDGFRVDYQQGIEPPAGADIATGVLVCSWANCTTAGCTVPRNTQQVTRQGVTMVKDLTRRFGLIDVDNWVELANGYRTPTNAGAVHSPDLPTVRQVTWEATP